VKLALTPAPDSTYTVNPVFVNLAVFSGVMATLFSPSKTSFGQPIVRSLALPCTIVQKLL
jgi:hypothetical protein